MANKDEVKLTLQQLLSLYTGGRPVGIREYGAQYDEFFEFYGKLSFLDEKKFSGLGLKEAERMNFRNMIQSIELQYPMLKTSKEFREVYKEYMKKVPNLYDNVTNDMYLNDGTYHDKSINGVKGIFRNETVTTSSGLVKNTHQRYYFNYAKDGKIVMIQCDKLNTIGEIVS